jgi:UDP-N-acetylglucosamine--N-acetylmuramyl-(pentapeptide) pyrophosphoryl-undecaprenol N-acetylglucosamine transferase
MLISPAFLSFLKRFWESYHHCRSVYRKNRPSVVLGMGGFTSTAPILAAKMAGVPSFIHESNAVPGRANRLAAKFATRVLLGFEDCRSFFTGASCVVTGTPVRKNLGRPIPRKEALKVFNLDPSRATLLVTGGSQGASGINQLLFKSAPLLPSENLQIIHLTGKNDDRLAAANYQRDHIPHYVAPFHHRMEEAYSAADLVISRAGASSLSELASFGLPSILIPYPYATDDHQRANAEIFVRSGAAELVNESEIQPEMLAVEVSKLMSAPERRSAMAEAARKLSPESASANVADVIERVVAEGLK